MFLALKVDKSHKFDMGQNFVVGESQIRDGHCCWDGHQQHCSAQNAQRNDITWRSCCIILRVSWCQMSSCWNECIEFFSIVAICGKLKIASQWIRIPNIGKLVSFAAVMKQSMHSKVAILRTVPNCAIEKWFGAHLPNSGGPLILTPKAAPPGTSRVAVIRL